MVYPSNLLRLVVSGPLHTTESFSWGLTLHPNFDPTPTAPEEVPVGVIDAVTTFHTAPAMAISTYARLELIKLNMIGPDGRYVDQGDTVLHQLDPTVGGAFNGGVPGQLSLAVSLGTGASRGRAHAGRFYPPATGLSTQNTGGITPTQQTSVATAAATMIDSINAALPDWRVCVASDIGTGQTRTVTHVRVGRIIDTIRSRRTSLSEEYVEAPIT